MQNTESGQIVRVKSFELFSARGRTFVFSVLYLLLSGIAISPLESKIQKSIAKEQPALKFDKLGEAAGEGAILGILGGMRALTADVIWIRMHEMWYEHNFAAAEAMIFMTVINEVSPFLFSHIVSPLTLK